MKSTELIRECTAPRLLLVAASPVLAATAAAALRGEMEILIALPSLLFAMFMQLAINYGGRYYSLKYNHGDHVGDPRLYMGTTPKAVQSALREMMIATSVLAVMVSLILTTMSSFWLMACTVVLFILAYFGVGGTRPMVHNILAPMYFFLLYGVVGTVVAGVLQIQYENPDFAHWYYLSPIVYMGLAVAFMASTVEIIKSYYDVEKDRDNLRSNFAATFGRKPTVATVYLNGVCMLALMAYMALTQHVRMPWLVLIPPVIAFVINCIIASRLYKSTPEQVRNLLIKAIYNMVVLTLLMIVVCLIVGDPNRSRLIYTYSFG